MLEQILVIGGVTIDVLHLPGRVEPVTAVGGAGMYTALAAQHYADHLSPAEKQRPRITLFAQRPNPLPEVLRPIVQKLRWIGPEISLEELPRLEIAHYGGGKAALLNAHWGAQARLTPDALPQDLSAYGLIHLAVMVSAQRQLEFLKVCRERSKAIMSAGTNGKNAHEQTATVQNLIGQTDLFFINENEANAIFGSVENAWAEPGKRLLITLGERGAVIVEGEQRVHLPAKPVRELDPTGAGDTFCGATLAGFVYGMNVVSAAREGIHLAGEMIQGIGPDRLLKVF